MPNLATLLKDMGVTIHVICKDYDSVNFAGVDLGEIHILTTACKPIKVTSVSVEIASDNESED